jgi:CSLREA domain-containing protein
MSVATRLTPGPGQRKIVGTLRLHTQNHIRRNRVVVAHAVALAGLLTLGLPAAGAATITVNSTADENTAAVDNGNCALREAISAANLNGAVDACAGGDSDSTDTISLPGGTYALTIEGVANPNDNGNGDLDLDLVQGSVTIDGPDTGTPATITSSLTSPAQRILETTTTTATGTLTLSDVVITGGDASAQGSGGGVRMAIDNDLVVEDSRITDNKAFTFGGGVSLSGDLVLTDSVVRGNSVNAPPSSGLVMGGGIESLGAVTITGSLIADNHIVNNATGNMALDQADGGGIRVSSGETLTIRDSTFSGNTVTATSPTPGPDVDGGGVASDSIVSITNTTFTGNTATGADVVRGGGMYISGNPGTHTLAHVTFAGNDAVGGTASFGDGFAINGANTSNPTVRGTIFSGPSPADTCAQTDGPVTITDGGGNVDEGTSCDIDNANSAESVGSADLEALATAGAMTAANSAGPPGDREQLPVMQPNLASPAVDRIAPSSCDDAAGADLTTDQRGFPRPFDTNENGSASCESGAVELYECLGAGATIVGTPGSDAGLIEGTNGPDIMHGGDGNDGGLFGLDGNDRICGGSGDDTVVARQGDDQIDGGEGTGDTAVFTASPGPVTVNLSTGTATGHGSDTLARVENARTGDFDDTLIGDALANTLQGSNGDDTYQGGTGTGPDGDDTFSDFDFGGFVNTVSYANRADAIGADVSSFIGDGGDLVGAESDSISGILDVVGGQGADEITGSAGQANTLTGGPGADTIAALSGADFIFARDGGPDSVDCGNDNPGDVDSVEADVQGTDTLTNCLAPDLLDFALPPPVNPDPGTGTGNPGTTLPTKPKCKKGRKLKKVKGKFKCVKKKRRKK